MHSRILVSVLAAALPVLALAQTPSTQASGVRYERLASLEYPWGMAFLPDGRLTITDRGRAD